MRSLLIFLAILYGISSPVLGWLTEEMQGLNVSSSSFISCYSFIFNIFLKYIIKFEYSEVICWELFYHLGLMGILGLNIYLKYNKSLLMAELCFLLGPENVLTKQIRKLYLRDPVSKGKYGKEGALLLNSSVTYIPVGFTASALIGLSLVHACISKEYADIDFKSLDTGSQLLIVQKRWDTIAEYTSSNSEFYKEVVAHHIENRTMNSEKCINALMEGEKFHNSEEYNKILEYENKYKKHILRYHRDSCTYNEFSYIKGPNGPKLITSTKDFAINLNQNKKDWNKLYEQLAPKSL